VWCGVVRGGALLCQPFFWRAMSSADSGRPSPLPSAAAVDAEAEVADASAPWAAAAAAPAIGTASVDTVDSIATGEKGTGHEDVQGRDRSRA
jgi:hypothetical protein